MPVLARAINELTEHIFMPVISQLSHRILQSLEFDSVIGDQIYITTDWSAHSITSDSTGNADVAQNFFNVEANIQLNPTSQKWDMYTFHHTTAYGIDSRIDYNEPIYYDKPNQIKMVETVSPVSIVMNCNLTVQSAELAFQTPQQIFNAHENGAVFHYNDLFFDYPVPKPIISVLVQIWRMDREFGKEAGVDFITYIKQRTNNGWNIAKHRELDEYEIVVPVYDLKALCTLEYSEDKPQGVMENKLPVAWSIPFVFTVQFGMPTLNILKYPCIINNQLLPGNCIPVDNNVRFNRMPEYHHGKQDEAYDKMKKVRPEPAYVQVPWYDDWIIPKARYLATAHTPFLVLDLQVEENSKINKIDFKQDFDPTYQLSPLVKEFFYQEGIYALDTHAPYHITMFRDDKELTPLKDFTFSDDLVLTFKAIDKISRYRIVMSVMTDVTETHPVWLPLLFKYYKYLGPLLKESIKNRILNGDLAKDMREIIINTIVGRRFISDPEQYWGNKVSFRSIPRVKSNFSFYIDNVGNIYDWNKSKIINIDNYNPIDIKDGDIETAKPKPDSVLSYIDFSQYRDIYPDVDGSYYSNINGNFYPDINDLPKDADGNFIDKDIEIKADKKFDYYKKEVTTNAHNSDARVFSAELFPREAPES